MYNYDVSPALKLKNLKFSISLQASIGKAGSASLSGRQAYQLCEALLPVTDQEAFPDL